MPADNRTSIKERMGSSVLEHVIKVRKPYTITKQRERWTEEEHNKFLEALKLYGRAWHQIEEHIGTKTAVQIRSHAQKFFTKVAREMTGDELGQVKTIEIPPPRPKKKPSHPYPRKLGNSHSNPVMRKQEWSSISNASLSEQNNLSTPKVSLCEQDNMSPASVISVAGSDTSGSPASDLMNSYTSPVSVSDLPKSGTSSVDDEENSFCQPKSDMELDIGTDDSVHCKEASSMEAPASSLKLFGQMVVVADAQKQNTTDGTRAVRLDERQTQWSSWPNGVTPMFYPFPSNEDLAFASEGGLIPMPCIWAPHISTNHLAFCREFSGNRCVESIVGCSVEASVGDRNTNSVRVRSLKSKFRSSETSEFRSLKTPSNQPAAIKGFVPYRRCVDERKVSNQLTLNDDIEARQLCL